MDVILWNAGPNGSNDFDWFGISRYIGPYKIAHWIKKHNYTCQVIDFTNRLSSEELYGATKKFISKDTKVIALSTTFLCCISYQWPDGTRKSFPKSIIDAVRLIRQEYPHIKFVLGGYGSDRVNAFGLFDASINSYTSAPEDIFLEYLEHLTKDTPLPYGKIINSFIGQDSKPRMNYNTARNPKYNIETDDFKFIKQDVILYGETLPLDVSRGCIFNCTFCQYPHLGKKKMDYIRSMSLLKEELLYNYDMFGTTNYIILDDTFNDTEWKLKEFHKITESLSFKINYTAYLRADLIERFEDTAHILKNSGLWGAFHGLESLHPYASKLVGKAWSGKKAKEFIPRLYHDLWKDEIPQQMNFIVGLPKETKEDLMSTIDWARQNDLYSVDFSSLTMFNYAEGNTLNYSIPSEFEKNPSKYGFEFDENGWKNESWTQSEAKKFCDEIRNIVKDTSGIHVFRLGILQSLGFNKEYLLKTPMNNLDWPEIINKSDLKLKQYYKQLMEL